MEISEEDLQKKIEEATLKATKGMFSQEQLDEVLKKRLSEKDAKHKAELEEKEKLAKMSADEKMKHDFEKLEAKLKEKEALIAQKEHSEKINALMGEKKISSEFFDLFSGVQDLEKAGGLMDKFNESLTAKINAEKDKLINPHTPQIQQTDSLNDDEVNAVLGIKDIK